MATPTAHWPTPLGYPGRRAACGYVTATTVIRCCMFEGQQYWLFLSWEESYAEYKTGLLTKVSECYMQDFEWMGICIFSWIDLNMLSTADMKEKIVLVSRSLFLSDRSDTQQQNTSWRKSEGTHVRECVKAPRDLFGFLFVWQWELLLPLASSLQSFLLVCLSSVMFSLSAG